jgi:uncharacterized protein involved in type VI secretion and phage assembly
VSDLQQQLLEVLDRLRSRCFGKYRGTVTGIDASTLRIKAKVPAVLGDQETGWAMACVPYAGDQVGFAFLPEVGAGVWIEFEGGDVSYPIWSGCYWRSDEVPPGATPAVKTIITAGNAKILIDDDAATITLSDDNQNEVLLDSSGVKLSRGASTLQVSDSEVNVNNGALEVM